MKMADVILANSEKIAKFTKITRYIRYSVLCSGGRVVLSCPFLRERERKGLGKLLQRMCSD